MMASNPKLARLLAPLDPAELALRNWVAPQLSASMVDEIARGDYSVDVDEHRRAIEELLRVRRLPGELSWHPAEVLSLARSYGLSGSPSDPETARRGHLIRLFSCVVLVRAGDGSPVNSLTPLVESAIELGPQSVDAAGSYLAWCRLHEPGDWRADSSARPFLTLSLVMLSALLPDGRSAQLLPGLISTFVDDLSAALADEDLLWTERPVRDLLKRTAAAPSRRTWATLASRFLIDGPVRLTEPGLVLARLGQAIRGDLAADAAELRSLLVPDPLRCSSRDRVDGSDLGRGVP